MIVVWVFSERGPNSTSIQNTALARNSLIRRPHSTNREKNVFLIGREGKKERGREEEEARKGRNLLSSLSIRFPTKSFKKRRRCFLCLILSPCIDHEGEQWQPFHLWNSFHLHFSSLRWILVQFLAKSLPRRSGSCWKQSKGRWKRPQFEWGEFHQLSGRS